VSEAYLLLWLEAPLQSWGHDSRFGRRDSLDFPTKSGVLGLLCCARGAGGAQTEWLARWADRDMQVIAYVLSDRQGEAQVRQPLMRDFHMVGNGYETVDPWMNLHVPKKSDGKTVTGGGTKITLRYYLQDMAYAVMLQGPHDELYALDAALRDPVWDLYLGRKCCAPTEFIAQGVRETCDQTVERAMAIAHQKRRHPVFRVRQGEHDGEVLSLNDVPLQFGTDKRYRDRRVTVQFME
jgi:CRISPR system Cascade subunit CasD